MHHATQVAAAVAAAIGLTSSGLAVAAPPTLAQAAAAANTLYMAGSSSARNGILTALRVNLCGGVANALTINSTGNTNFFAVSCTPTAVGVPAGVATVYYRAEGGSVVGALPIVTNAKIAQLDLSNSLGTTARTLANFIIGVLQTEVTDPHLVDVLAIPGNGDPFSAASLPVSGTSDGSPAIYINTFTRAGVSCNTPISAL